MHKSIQFWVVLYSLFCCCCWSSSSTAHASQAPAGEAPRAGMANGSWSSAIKQMFGTAYEAYDSNNQYSAQSPTAPISKVWFTGNQGALSEIFWPTIDTPQVRDSQFLVTDGVSFFFEEKRDAISTVTWLENGVPAFQVINKEKSGKFQIERTVFADPDRDVVLQHVRITRNVPNLQFYILHKPNAANTPMGNTAFASIGEAPGAGLYASQSGQAQAVVASIGLKAASAGFTGASDGWQDISKNFTMTQFYRTATTGNVAVTGWLNIPTDQSSAEFDIAIGFGTSNQAAYTLAQASIQQGWQVLLNKYVSQWEGYQASLKDLSAGSNDGGVLFRSSAAIIKSVEDKTYAGATVASPTVPWGDHLNDTSGSPQNPGYQTSGYHMIWPRDLYQMATAFLSVNDTQSALACLNYLKRVQLGPNDGTWTFGFRTHARNGSWYQNARASGQPYWTGLQMDETAMPLILAYRMWQGGTVKWQDYWDMVSRGADFIAAFGPWSQEERWEESFGASPSTIASEISALWTSAEFADAAGDTTRAANYRAIAQAWSSKPGDNIDTWTFTTSGNQGSGSYYIRVEGSGDYNEIWNPNSTNSFTIANGGGLFVEKNVIDGGFLELVRFGVKNSTSPNILDSVAAYDQSIKVDIPGVGPGYHRYLGDRYGYDGISGAQTDGMLWPLLTGERGDYELAKAIDSGLNAQQIDAAVAPYVQTIENMSTQNHMIPEQVWENGPGAGLSTGSATPLGWSHGEYLKILRSRVDKTVFDRLPVVFLHSSGR